MPEVKGGEQLQLKDQRIASTDLGQLKKHQ